MRKGVRLHETEARVQVKFTVHVLYSTFVMHPTWIWTSTGYWLLHNRFVNRYERVLRRILFRFIVVDRISYSIYWLFIKSESIRLGV